MKRVLIIAIFLNIYGNCFCQDRIKLEEKIKSQIKLETKYFIFCRCLMAYLPNDSAIVNDGTSGMIMLGMPYDIVVYEKIDSLVKNYRKTKTFVRPEGYRLVISKCLDFIFCDKTKVFIDSLDKYLSNKSIKFYLDRNMEYSPIECY